MEVASAHGFRGSAGPGRDVGADPPEVGGATAAGDDTGIVTRGEKPPYGGGIAPHRWPRYFGSLDTLALALSTG